MAIEVKGKWRRRSRAQWRAVFERFGAGGLGVVAFCEREGISVSSFRRWRSLLADAAPITSPLVPASTPIETYIDAHYDNAFMSERFETMTIGEKPASPLEVTGP